MKKNSYFLSILLVLLIACKKDEKGKEIQIQSIKIDFEEASIMVGASLKLIASHNPNNAVKPDYEWTSDNIDVVEVSSEGEVNAKSVGNAIVTVKEKKSNLTARSKITVLPITSTSIKLNTINLNLAIGENHTLTFIIEPSNATSKEVTWTSLDNNIATVSNSGEVSAIGVGETIIEVKSKDGKSKAECAIKVNPILISSLSLEKSNIILTVGEQEKISVSILPNNATNKTLNWTSSNPLIASVSQLGDIRGLSKGICIISVKSSDGHAQASAIVNVIEDIKYDKMIFENLKSDLLNEAIAYNELKGNNLGEELKARETIYTIEIASDVSTNRLTTRNGGMATFNLLSVPSGNITRINSNFSYNIVPNSKVDGSRWLTINFFEKTWEISFTFGFKKTYKYSENVQLTELKKLIDEDIERQRKYVMTGGI